MEIGATLEQTADGCHLSLLIPDRTRNEPICRIMQGSALAVVPGGVRVGAGVEQQPDNLDTVPGRRQVQQSVPNVNPMEDARMVQLRLAKDLERKPSSLFAALASSSTIALIIWFI